MSFIVPPEDGFAPVPDLGSFRFRRRRRLPAEVVDQLHVAAQLVDELLEAGVELRFDAPGEGARMRAILVDTEGNEIREVALRDVVELDLGDPTA
jgi:hypothetical protein